jgi:SAM-dependent methyltransferase
MDDRGRSERPVPGGAGALAFRPGGAPPHGRTMEKVRDFYGRVWREYADPAGHPLVADGLRTQTAILRERTRREGYRRILDLGCGPVPASRPELAPLVVHADIVATMLGDLKHTLGGPVVCLDAAKLPFKDGSFQLVWCSLLVDHVADLPSWLRELFRVIEPGGTLGLASWDQTILPPRMYPQGGMRFETVSGEVLTVPIHRNWEQARRLLAGYDPGFQVESYPIVENEYVLQVAWVRRQS